MVVLFTVTGNAVMGLWKGNYEYGLVPIRKILSRELICGSGVQKGLDWRQSSESSIDEVRVLVAQSWLPLCDPLDCSLPGSSVHGLLQAQILKRIAVPFFRGSSHPRD